MNRDRSKHVGEGVDMEVVEWCSGVVVWCGGGIEVVEWWSGVVVWCDVVVV